MKPFNLEAAKAGAKLVTSNGHPCVMIAHVPAAKPNDRVVFLLDGEVYTCSETGDDSPPCYQHEGVTYHDFTIGMAVFDVTKAVNIYRARDGSLHLGAMKYDTFMQAKHAGINESNEAARLVGTTYVRWQE